MNNVVCIVPKQLCSLPVLKHGGLYSLRFAPQPALLFRSFTSVTPSWLTSENKRPQSLINSSEKKKRICQFIRGFHSSQNCLKSQKSRSGKATKHKPQQPQSRALERVKSPFGIISKIELSQIYQQDVDYIEGNEILRMLHERRTEGSLIDKGIQPEGNTTIPRESLLKAVEWLRKTYPVDEQTAAERWTAQEAARLEQKYIADAERLGLYKPMNQSAAQTTSDTSTSVLEEWRAYNKQQNTRQVEEAEKSGKAQESRELALARQEEKEKKQLESAERIEQRRQERAVQGMVTTDGELPPLTQSQRLIWPLMFSVVFLSLVAIAARTYRPVEQDERLFPDIPLSVATIGGIVAINVMVFLLWHFPPAWRLLNTYATQVPAYPYAFSVLGNTFSHRKFIHLCSNVLGIFLFGIEVHEQLGRARFLELYLNGCIIGSLFSLFYYVGTRNFAVYTQGASGAVFALMAAWAWTNISKPPSSIETHEFALDVSRWAVIGITLLGHIPTVARASLDWMSHVGGAAKGFQFIWSQRIPNSRIGAETMESDLIISEGPDIVKKDNARDKS